MNRTHGAPRGVRRALGLTVVVALLAACAGPGPRVERVPGLAAQAEREAQLAARRAGR
jgi:hypothetical protein